MEMTLEEKFDTVKKYCKNIDKYFIKFAELLCDIKHTKAFRMKGYKTFKSFVENEYMINNAFVSRLISCYKFYIIEWAFDEDLLNSIGFEKLSIIKPLLKDTEEIDLVEAWLNKAADDTNDTELLREMVKTELEKQKPEITKKELFTNKFIETMTSSLNCSMKELKYLLALYFDGEDLSTVKNIMKTKKKLFELEW